MLNFKRAIQSMSILALLAPAIGHSDNHHEFTIGMLPDTQTYTSLRPQIMEAQIDWITANQATENIIYVGHLGDLKDRGACVNATLAWPSLASPSTEWQIVRRAYDQLDLAVIRYGVAPGNHDFDQQNGVFPNDSGGCPSGDNNRPLVGYDTQFPVESFPATGYGRRVPGSNDDNFTMASSNGVDFLFINLGYRQEAPAAGQTATIDWAEGLMLANPNHLTIVTSHFLVDCNESTNNNGSVDNSCAGTPDNMISSYGANIFDRLRSYPNLFMLIGGHRFGETYFTLDRSAENLNPVHAVLANYQHLRYSSSNFDSVSVAGPPDGTSGFFKLMRFDMDSMTVDLDSVSPALAANAGISGTPPTVLAVLSNGDRPTTVFSPRDIDVSNLNNLYDNGDPATGNPLLHTQSVSNLVNISFAGYTSIGGGGGDLVWTISGPGTTTGVTNTNGSQSFTYVMNPAGLSTTRTWTVTSEPVPAAGDYTVNWNYSGLHAWFAVTAFLNTSDGTSLVNAGPQNCCTTPSNGFNYSGSKTFANVAAGQTLSFSMGGRNFDINNFLRGTLTLTQQ